jgi:probable F420-dependent oxidoreductase
MGMKIDVVVRGPELREVSALARLAEDIGFDALYTVGKRHDPFPPLGRAAEHTTRIGLGASIAVSFPRGPTTLAHLSDDLQEYSRGRLVLAVSAPYPRMRGLVEALRAGWRARQERSFCVPPPHPYGPPRIHLTAIGPAMTELAGEIADGLLLHGLITPRYLQETTVPALERGLRSSGRSWDDLEVIAPGHVVTGTTDEAYARSVRRVRETIVHHAATPACRRVLESGGFDVHGGISDELVDAVAVRGEPAEIPDLLVARYGAVCRRVQLKGPFHDDPGMWAAVVSRTHEITSEPVPS